MKSVLKRLIRPILRITKPDSTMYDGVTIPIADMRFGGQNFNNDADFVITAEKESLRLIDDFGLTKESALLEIGCGTGRLPIGIMRTIGKVKKYEGIDVSDAAIDWCKRHIEAHHPEFQFTRINVKNDRYNPDGSIISEEFRLPIANGSYDIIYLYSVFSHMELEDCVLYLKEFKRVLKPGGKVFLTTFIEENVPKFEVNPKDYRTDWKGALHCVRFDKMFFKQLISQYGFQIDAFHYAKETDGQSGVYLSKA
ncbi:MAG: class I SAM-dependent methyltransferase [bacterium]|nr:class I SAM-dependent methyltransferase [bacterium]